MDKAKINLQFVDVDNTTNTISTKSFGNQIAFLTTIEKKDSLVYLDIPTAIKFYKTLRNEINKAKEVQNG